ncbi:TPA: SMEK domain-containing protein, partial [Campylobacter jejuni]|nr:SMEK domain-containing protein [Campylobacter jejuni]
MEDIIKIIQWFSELSSKIKLSNKLNLTDINICCENDFSQILNNIYNWKLYNINKQCKNAEAIDLIDNENRIAIQITSNTSTKKIKNTIDKFKKTKFSNYEFYMFYLTDDLPNNTKKNISQNNIKSLCFLDLIQELHFNSLKAKKFITEITEKTIIEKFKNYLKYPNQWSFNYKLNIYYNNINPNFRLKLSECNEENEQYSWLCEIKAISKRYQNTKLHYDCIKLFYNDIDLNIQTFSIQFYQEGLTITAPQPLYINDERDLYFYGYITNDERLDIDSLLTYFFNHNANKISYGKFVKTRKNLIYKKCFETWIPLIFFKDYNELENFKKFIN